MHLLTIVRENNVNMTARYTVMDTSYIINTMQGKSQEKFTKIIIIWARNTQIIHTGWL